MKMKRNKKKNDRTNKSTNRLVHLHDKTSDI